MDGNWIERSWKKTVRGLIDVRTVRALAGRKPPRNSGKLPDAPLEIRPELLPEIGPDYYRYTSLLGVYTVAIWWEDDYEW
jgi:hypothetical protein